MIFGLPITGFYVLGLAFFLWFVLEYLPIGRYLYAIGANPRAAAPQRYSGSAIYGRCLRRVGTANRGCRRAPRLAAQDRPGERRPRISASRFGRRLSWFDDHQAGPVNVWGTMIGVAILAVGIAGIPAIRRLVLGRTYVHTASLCSWPSALRATPSGRSSAAERQINKRATDLTRGRNWEKTHGQNGIFHDGDERAGRLPSPGGRRGRTRSLTKRRPSWRKRRRARTNGTAPRAAQKLSRRRRLSTVAGDMRNGGILGVAHGLKEASDVLGWTYREIDGQGTVSGQAAALSQAIALKPDAIVVGGSDAVQQNAGLEDAAKQGIAIVGWHAGPKPGPMDGAPVFANVTTDAMEVAKVAAMKAIAESNGKAGVCGLRRFGLRHRHRQGSRHGVLDQEVRGLQGAGLRGYAARRYGESRAPADHDSASAIRPQMDPLAGDQRSLLRFDGPLVCRSRV